MIQIRKLSLAECGLAGDVVVVIDVLRAFSAEAYAFDRGVSEIIAVGTVEAALAWKERDPAVLVMGEVNGFPVPGFDLWNSPGQILSSELARKRLVHRTSAGTQGILCSSAAKQVFAASLVCARATAKALLALNPAQVDFIITGQNEIRDGDEDIACADYISAFLQGQEPDPAVFIERVHASDTGQRFYRETPADLWMEDLRLCCLVDCFDFAMRVDRDNSDFVVRAM